MNLSTKVKQTQVTMNGMIESLWQVCDEVRSEIPADPALVIRTEHFIRHRAHSGALSARFTGMQHRVWRIRNALRRSAHLELTLN